MVIEIVVSLQVLRVVFMCSSQRPFWGLLVLTIVTFVRRAVLGVFLRTWLMWAIVLIFVGGVIILFLYCVRLTRNSKEKEGFVGGGYKLISIVFILILFRVLLFFGENFSETGRLIKDCYTQRFIPILAGGLRYLLGGLMVCVNLTTSFKGKLEISWF